MEEIVENCNVSVGAVHYIIHNSLNYCKTCARSVPRQLMDNHKETRLHVCRELKQRYLIEGDGFLERTVTSDEIWIHHYEPECKWQSME